MAITEQRNDPHWRQGDHRVTFHKNVVQFQHLFEPAWVHITRKEKIP